MAVDESRICCCLLLCKQLLLFKYVEFILCFFFSDLKYTVDFAKVLYHTYIDIVLL